MDSEVSKAQREPVLLGVLNQLNRVNVIQNVHRSLARPKQTNKQTKTNRQMYTFVFLHIMQENYTLNRLTHFFPVTSSTDKTKLLAENICQSVSLLNTWFLETGLQCV